MGQTAVRFHSDYVWAYDPLALLHNVTNVAGTSPGSPTVVALSGTFGSTRPPRLVSVTVADADNGDEAYGYCDTITFAFDMMTDLAADPAIDMCALSLSLTPTLTPTLTATLTRALTPAPPLA